MLVFTGILVLHMAITLAATALTGCLFLFNSLKLNKESVIFINFPVFGIHQKRLFSLTTSHLHDFRVINALSYYIVGSIFLRDLLIAMLSLLGFQNTSNLVVIRWGPGKYFNTIFGGTCYDELVVIYIKNLNNPVPDVLPQPHNFLEAEPPSLPLR